MKTAEEEVAAEAADKKAVAVHRGVGTGGGSIARLQVKSFSELENLAVILGKSDIVPKDMIGKPANIMLALMFANELGLTPAQGLQNIMVVNGRPTLWGDAVMGLVEASNLQENWKDEFLEGFEGGAVRFVTKRKGREPVIRTFSMLDAKTAKLTEKDGPWKQYPKRMLFHRARSWALRDAYPDVLKGIRYYEEERDVVNTTAERGPVYDVPKETAAGAAASAPPPPAAAPSTPPPAAPVEGTEVSFRVAGGATSTYEGKDCFVARDDAETPNKYYHDNPEWHAAVKAAKEAKAYITVRWVEKPAEKGPIRWLVALSLKS